MWRTARNRSFAIRCATASPCAWPSSPRSSSTEVDLGLEIGARIGVHQGLIEGDAVLLHEAMQRDVEALHAPLTAGDDGFLDAHDIALLDQLADMWRVQHHFDRRDAHAVLAH